MEWGSPEANTLGFCIGAFIGLIIAIIKIFLYKNGYKKDGGIGTESIIAIILGIIFAFGDDK